LPEDQSTLDRPSQSWGRQRHLAESQKSVRTNRWRPWCMIRLHVVEETGRR
jgi:hypothetical protein